MDIKMSDMSGVNVTARMRRDLNRIWARTSIIIFTANVFRGDYDKCLAASRNDYLAKIFEDNELMHRIIAVQ